MKRCMLLLSCICSLLTGFAQDGYTVKVKLSNLKNYTPYIAFGTANGFTMDTSHTTEKGWMVFKGKVTEPVLANFGTRGNPASFIKVERGAIPGPSLQFFLTNEEITITGDADEVYMATVKGGLANNEWATIKAAQNKLTQESWMTLKNTHENFKPGDDSAAFDRMRKLREHNSQLDAKLQRDFIEKNPGSLVSMYFLAGMQNSLSLEELKVTYNKLHNTYKNNSIAQKIDGKIKSMEATAIGKKAIDIRKKDINGKDVTLETLKGKYVLLDFWGSWCGPCRQSHPHLKALYDQYKADGFEIVGIAQEQGRTLEESRKAWKQAIEQDGIGWLQVLNNEGIDQFDAVKAYGVTAFPTKILLDKEGKIVARYIGDGKEIDAKLAEAFGKNAGIHFEHDSWAAVKAKAKAENKLIFIDVYTSWCGPCKMMAKDVFPLPKVGATFNSNFINYKIDAEKGEGIGLAKEYDVHAYPTYLFVNGDGILFYRSLGSMSEDRFLTEASNALTEFGDPRPLPIWEKEYPAKKNDKAFLLDYIKKRRKLRLNSADIIDQYTTLCTKEELLNPEVLSVLLKTENANVDGPFYAFISANKEAVVKASGSSKLEGFNYLLNRFVSTDLARAIDKKDEVLMEKIVAARMQLPQENTPLSWEVSALRMRFYTETSNEKKLTPLLKQYSKEVLAYDKEKIKKANAESVQQFEQMVEKGLVKNQKPEEIEQSRKYYAQRASTDYAYRVRSLAEAALKEVNDKTLLQQALQWMQVASSYSDNFTMPEITAGLLHKLGRKNEALAQQQKAIAAFNDMKLNNEIIQNRLTGNLEKMKAGQPTWIVEKQSKIATKG